MLDCTTETLNALSSLKIDTGTWDIIIIYIVSHKLDPESRKKWECKVSESVTLSEQLPTLEQFKDFLQTRYFSLEFLEPKQGFVQQHKYVNNNYKGNFSPVKGNHVQKVNNLHITNNVSRNYCKGDHRIIHCKDFNALDVDVKRNYVQTNGMCFNCLGNNHSARYCKLTTNCQICNRRHHSLLHQKANEDREHSASQTVALDHTQQVTNSMGEATPGTSVSNHFVNEVSQQGLLATAVVKAKSWDKEGYLMRALIDPGSEVSFITSAAVNQLGLKPTAVKVSVTGLRGQQMTVLKSTVQVTIASRTDSRSVIEVTAYVIDKVTSNQPSAKVSITSWPELQSVELADPDYRIPNKIDVLLGANVYARIIQPGLFKSPQETMVAQKTSLGWIICGEVGLKADISCKLVSMHTQVEQLDRSYWELKSKPTNNPRILTPEEKRSEEINKATTTRDEHGRQVVKLPFRDEQPTCVEYRSREIPLRRFHCLEKKFQTNKCLQTKYRKVFREYKNSNHMEPLHSIVQEANKDGVYLPFNAVVREDFNSSKVGIVFGASCKGIKEETLNSDIIIGPTSQPKFISHVQSEQNKADYKSREISASEESKQELWLNGAKRLKQDVSDHKVSKPKNTQAEERKINTHREPAVWSKYSSLTKLLRIVAYCRKFLKIKGKVIPTC